MDEHALAQALAKAQKWVGAVDGVVMVGQGKDCIDVWVTKPVDLPREVMGVPVRVRESGQIQAQ